MAYVTKICLTMWTACDIFGVGREIIGGGGVVLSIGDAQTLFGSCVAAYNCPNCKKIIIDYEV